jgi:hypothetical protein
MGWVKLFVKARREDHSRPERMLELDEVMYPLGASLIYSKSSGLPVRQPDGSYELHVMDSEHGQAVKDVLELEGINILREEKHSGPYPMLLCQKQP